MKPMLQPIRQSARIAAKVKETESVAKALEKLQAKRTEEHQGQISQLLPRCTSVKVQS
jgi:hypothetical protein